VRFLVRARYTHPRLRCFSGTGVSRGGERAIRIKAIAVWHILYGANAADGRRLSLRQALASTILPAEFSSTRILALELYELPRILRLLPMLL